MRPTGLLRLLPATTALSAALVLAVPSLATPAAAVGVDYEMPFPCGQAWTGRTRASHSPNRLAVDWNRPDDVDDPVVASAAGVVAVADRVDNGGYGKHVVIDHGERASTMYAHLNTVGVRVGQTLSRGSTLGTVGSTGRSTGPHLHYEQRQGRSPVHPVFHGLPFVFGSTLTSRNCAAAVEPAAVPLAARFEASPLANLVLYRAGSPSTFSIRRHNGTTQVARFGGSEDLPVLGDWDGNGLANPGVHNPARRVFALRTPSGVTRIVFGRAGDRAVAGDWDGDGRYEIGVRRAGTDRFRLRRANGSVVPVALGDSDDLPVTGDWNGDRITDLGVFDPTTARFTLRAVDTGGMVWTASVTFGSAGDLPVAGDWDGNGRTDLGVYDPATGRFELRRAPSATSPRARVLEVPFAAAG